MDLMKTLFVYMMLLLGSATETNPATTPVPVFPTASPYPYTTAAPYATATPYRYVTAAPTAIPSRRPSR